MRRASNRSRTRGRRTSMGLGFSIAATAWLVVLLLLGSLARSGRLLMSDEARIDTMIARTGVVAHLYDVVLPELVLRKTAGGVRLGSGQSAPTFVLGPDDRRWVAEAIEQIAPRDWASRELKSVALQMGGYLTGQRGTFSVELSFGDRAAVMDEAAATLMQRMDLGSRLHLRLLTPKFEREIRTVMSEALGLPVGSRSLRSALAEVAPPDWLDQQMLGAVRASEPFFAGETNAFSFTVRLEPVVRQGADVLRDELGQDTLARDLLLDRIVDPMIENHLDEVKWPRGLTLEDEDVRRIIEKSIPRDWAIQKGEIVLGRVEAFLVGQSDRLEIRVSVAERKLSLKEGLTEAMIAAATERLEALPRCGIFEIARATKALSSGEWPTCTPGSAGLLVAMASDEIREKVTEAVDALPDEAVVNEEALEQQLGKPAMDRLRALRDRVRTGVRFDETDVGWVQDAPLAEQPGAVAVLRGRPMGRQLPSKVPSMIWMRNVMSNEWLWWALALGTLATVMWARRGGVRKRLYAAASLLWGAGMITAIGTFTLGYVDWVGRASAFAPPWVETMLSPSLATALNAEIRTLWHRIATEWFFVSVATGFVAWLLARSNDQKLEPTSK